MDAITKRIIKITSVPGVHKALMEDPVKVAESNLLQPLMKLNRIRELTDKVGDAMAPHVICKKGCSHCCNMAVSLSSIEAEQIGRAIGKPPAKIENRNGEMDEDFQKALVSKYMNVPCPFLKEGACSIYEHRPVSCRTFFNLSDDVSLCDLTKGPQQVPGLDFRAVWYAYSLSLFRFPFGDIREFWPQGLEDGQATSKEEGAKQSAK